MSKLHDRDLLDNEKPLYVFEHEVISDRLINALKSFYKAPKNSSKSHYIIQLVPAREYFVSYLGGIWTYSEKVHITQEQVDKYLVLYDTISMPFLEYMEILYEELKDLPTTKYTIEE